MTFNDFTYPDVLNRLGLQESVFLNAYRGTKPVEASPRTQAALGCGAQLGSAAHSELARTVWMVGPVLLDLWERFRGQINLNADVHLNVDQSDGLCGRCDFTIGHGPQRHVIRVPTIVICQAARDSIPDSLGRCIASMVGLLRYNQRHGIDVDSVHGCVTTGSAWKFLHLTGNILRMDLMEYGLSQVDRILGILARWIDPAGDLVQSESAAEKADNAFVIPEADC